MSPYMDIPTLHALESRLGIVFSNLEILEQAVTHRSFANEAPDADRIFHNERLEFLGDAVLGLIVGQMLMAEFPDANEGELTKMRAALVNGDRLAKFAEKLGLGQVIRLGKGEDKSGGRKKPSILADAFEAVLAAAYLDGGMDASRTIIQRSLGKMLAEARDEISGMDSKSLLQEYLQTKGMAQPKYDLVSFSGPDHNRVFNVQVSCGLEILGTGSGRSKKAAEQDAAKNVRSVIDSEKKVIDLQEDDK